MGFNQVADMDKKYLKISAAGQLAARSIKTIASERAILEYAQKQPGLVFDPSVVDTFKPSDVAALVQKGWLRETEAIPEILPSPALPNLGGSPSTEKIAEPTSNATTTPSLPSAPPETESRSPRSAVIPPVEVSEEEKARSFENFLKIMSER